ncbi:MAG TPA: helix-turn-helix transcriptional regulator [Thermoanaerobaculia bacterium]
MNATVPPVNKSERLREAIEFGARVRELRVKRDLTQEQLAESAGMNVVQLSNLERGANEPKLSTILRLAQALGVTLAEFFRPFDKRK